MKTLILLLASTLAFSQVPDSIYFHHPSGKIIHKMIEISNPYKVMNELGDKYNVDTLYVTGFFGRKAIMKRFIRRREQLKVISI